LFKNFPGFAEMLIDKAGNETFDTLQNILQLKTFERLDRQMHMIGHHRERRCKVSLVLEVE
jgi:hypothetical protein